MELIKAWIQPARLVTIGLLSLVIFLGYQHLTLWYQGSAYSSVYAQPHLPKVVKLKVGKGEEEVKVPCVDVKAIVKKSPSDQAASHNRPEQGPNLQPSILGEIAGHSPEIQPLSAAPDFPLLLSRYLVKGPLFSDLVLESYLEKDGSNRIAPAQPNDQPRKRLFEIGRMREFGLWFGPEWAQPAGLQGLDQLETQSNHFGYSLDISYKQDLLRVGPVWSGLRTEGGYSSNLGWHAKAQVGIPIFRF